MVRISEQTGFGYLRLSKGELENEKDLLANPERGRQEGFLRSFQKNPIVWKMRRDSWQAWKGEKQEGFPLEALSEKSNCLVNENRLLASLEGGRQEGFLRSFQKNPIVW